jgi:hypothetical protein
MSQVQRDEVGAKLQITEQEARQYYQANRNEFVEPAAVTFREILIELPAGAQTAAGVNVAADDEVKQQDRSDPGARACRRGLHGSSGGVGLPHQGQRRPDRAAQRRRPLARRSRRCSRS